MWKTSDYTCVKELTKGVILNISTNFKVVRLIRWTHTLNPLILILMNFIQNTRIWILKVLFSKTCRVNSKMFHLLFIVICFEHKCFFLVRLNLGPLYTSYITETHLFYPQMGIRTDRKRSKTEQHRFPNIPKQCSFAIIGHNVLSSSHAIPLRWSPQKMLSFVFLR